MRAALLLSSPFKTPEFKALFEAWNKLLEATGHKEIEDHSHPDTPLKDWHSLNWKGMNPEEIECAKEYYSNAEQVLLTFGFKSYVHKRIWKMHCEGLSVRKIAGILNYPNFKKSMVQDIIKDIQLASGIKRDPSHG